MSDYVLDQENNVYIRPEQKGIGYADGGEKKLLEIVSSANDRSTFSNEFLPFMTDWPIEYHLSRKRHLILRSLNIRPGDRVLELGCGCGAITRYLLEIGAKVTAVEGELTRAAVAAKRCEGFDTIQFIADDFLNLSLPEKYDWVLMIGVLEYSQKYGKKTDRQGEYLQIAKQHLNSNGTLVIAIENKIGIKYLNGAGEDHNGICHYGSHDLYDGDDVTTWGKEEIRDILLFNGFSYQHFSGVFPDYKLPKIILNEVIESERDFRAEELLHYTRSLDYRGMNQRFFDEPLVTGTLRKNGLLIHMANSFLITAKISNPIDIDKSILAVYYAVDRKIEYCTETEFILANEGKLVRKKKLNCAGIARPVVKCINNGSIFEIKNHHSNDFIAYHKGELLGQLITKAFKRRDLEKVGYLIEIWLIYLSEKFSFYDRKTGGKISRKMVKGKKLSNLLIDGLSFDCGPHNIIMNQRPMAFDLEWVATTPIPLVWQLGRNCQHILRSGYGDAPPVSLADLVGLSSTYLNVVATTVDLEEFICLESQFQNIINYAEPSSKIKITSLN